MRVHALAVWLLITCIVGSAACGVVGKPRYEYEQELYLDLDGSATLSVHGSTPAFVALHGFDLDIHPRARLDRAKIRRLFTSPGVRVSRVSASRREGRRFLHVRLEIADVRTFTGIGAATSRYTLRPQESRYVFAHAVAPTRGPAVSDVGWNGSEVVAFRVHLPSRITLSNAQRMERGNILAWTQTLDQRVQGVPLRMEALMEGQSILYGTLRLFALVLVVAVGMMAAVIWWIVRKGTDLNVESTGVAP